MAMSAGALRRWLIDHDALPEAPLIAMVPVSVRHEASASALGNKVSAMLAVLPTNLDGPLERFGRLTRRHSRREAPTCRDPPRPRR
jgi:diacylglycerol O-acyltransferase / wax synthase